MSWSPCELLPLRNDELCDGSSDDDCDGVLDEGCPCDRGDARNCLESDSTCISGVQLCSDQGTWGDTCVGQVVRDIERCDLVDNDCDGEVDENNVCPCYTFGTPDRFYLACGSASPDTDPTGIDHATSWAEASNRCRSLNLELTSINSETENDLIFQAWDALTQQGLFSPDYVGFWIGLNDLETENAFVWSDGSPLTYTRWDGNEPNNGAQVFEEDCAIVRLNPLFRRSFWDDHPCQTVYPFVCEGSFNP